MPWKPIKAKASKPAVIRAIGVPLNAFGTLLSANCSLMPANNIIATPKPTAKLIAYTTLSPKFIM